MHGGILNNFSVTYDSGAQLKTMTAIPEPACLDLSIDPFERGNFD